jgi:hypothetical protein
LSAAPKENHNAIASIRKRAFEQFVVRGRYNLQQALEVVMRVERVEVSWDAERAKWAVRIEAGEEVIRRHSDVSKSTDEPTLRAAAAQMVRDEGYEVDDTQVVVHR